MKLRVGRIAYTNLFPIFYGLQRLPGAASYEFIDGVPSELNRKIRTGEIDISPSSSVEYLKHGADYQLIEGQSISSFGPVGSVLLFSRRPLEGLQGRTILTSSQSDTSVALLAVILRKFYGVEAELRSTTALTVSAQQADTAVLLIGDDAMKEALKWPREHIHDLGELWYRHTGLPAVFALWIARTDSAEEKPALLRQFLLDLEESRKAAPGAFREIAGHSWLRQVIPEEELIAYWQGISYEFGDAHRKGLELFGRYAAELGLLQG